MTLVSPLPASPVFLEVPGSPLTSFPESPKFALGKRVGEKKGVNPVGKADCVKLDNIWVEWESRKA